MDKEDNVLVLLKQLHQKLGRRPTKWDDSRLYCLSRKHFGTWNKMMEAAGYPVHWKQEAIIPSEVTPEFAYFMGIVITDGHVQDSKKKNGQDYCCVQLSTSYPAEVKVLTKLSQSLFNYKPLVREKLYSYNVRINHELHISSKLLVKYLESLGIPSGNKSFRVRIPKCIINGTNELKFSFLRGIIDGDGAIKIPDGQIAIGSRSYTFLEDVTEIYKSLNIKPGKICQDRNGFLLRVSNQSAIKEIYQKCYKNSIFYYPRKFKRLRQAIKKRDLSTQIRTGNLSGSAIP